MKDTGARALALQAQQAVQKLREEQSEFMGTVLEQIANALTPVATQASKAVADAARVGAQVQHIQESLEVLALEGNAHRVDLNAVREAVAQHSETMYQFINAVGRVSALYSAATVEGLQENGVLPQPNRETRRRIERDKRQH